MALSDRASEIARLLDHERTVRKKILSLFDTEARAIRRWRIDLPVALVLGGPRGGTSAFKGTLSKHSAFLSLSGEHRIFFTLLGLNFPDGSLESECGNLSVSSDEREEILEMLLMSSFGGPEVEDPSDREALRYAWDWAYRLPMQWTGLRFDVYKIVDLILGCVAEYKRAGNRDLRHLDNIVLKSLATAHPQIDLSFYDGQVAHPTDPSWQAARLLPIQPIVEITPFVVPRPRLLKSLSLPAHYLLLKASSDPSRLETLRSVFEQHIVHVLRLTRNPLASINGLIDGWDHHCFWQHNLEAEFGQGHKMSGWCFDIIRNRRRFVESEGILPVVVQQWVEPNFLIEQAAESENPNERWSRYQFEDFVRSDESRSLLLEKVLGNLNVQSDPVFERAVLNPPKVNVTVTNETARWRRRSPLLLPIASQPDVARIAKKLGYETEEMDDWI
ncbi:hypothetical protein LJR245_007560 [Rhizobium leguminosarum]|uniref:hypothetical protein n=1 Tax=Rhizobium leguminosarum TaxID=384 RepID=UPI003ECF5B7B